MIIPVLAWKRYSYGICQPKAGYAQTPIGAVKLQVLLGYFLLKLFRRICILKGIYPVEPKNKKKAGRGNSQPKVWFHAKDIAFLAREPLIETFRTLRIHQRRLKRAREKLDRDKEFRLRMNKPSYTLHQLVRERYPTRRDALRDLSDSLNLLFLFSRLPRLTHFHPALISLCRRFCVEFLHYVIAMRSIRKVTYFLCLFLKTSIGIYQHQRLLHWGRYWWSSGRLGDPTSSDNSRPIRSGLSSHGNLCRIRCHIGRITVVQVRLRLCRVNEYLVCTSKLGFCTHHDWLPKMFTTQLQCTAQLLMLSSNSCHRSPFQSKDWRKSQKMLLSLMT